MAVFGMTASRILASVALALILSGCAKKHLYPGDRRPDDQVAYVEAERFLMAGVEFGIDGVAVGSLAQYYMPQGLPDEWLPGRPTVGASVLPGSHRLSAHVASYGWVTTARTACVAMTFQAESGQRYKLFIEQGELVMVNMRTGAKAAATGFENCLPRPDTGLMDSQRSNTPQ